MKTYYVGLATTLHDPAIAIVSPQGEVLFAEATERYLQSKRAINCEPDPLFRIRELLETYCDPKARFVIARTWSPRYARFPLWVSIAGAFGFIQAPSLSRFNLDKTSAWLLLERYRLLHLLLCSVSSRVKAGANLVATLRQTYGNRNVVFYDFEHHLTHAATACYTSPFEQAACLIVDGHGEQGTISFFHYQTPKLRLVRHHRGPESLGALYMLVTELCGFSSLKGEEWKVMGLAPYGQHDAAIARLLGALAKPVKNGIRYASPSRVRQLCRALQPYARVSGTDALSTADLAHTWQAYFCELMDALLAQLHALAPSEDLVLSGGCALNSSYAGTILGRLPFQRLYIPSAPADDGNALGAALLAHRRENPGAPLPAIMASPYLGSEISQQALKRVIGLGHSSKARSLSGCVHLEAAKLLASGKILGWVQGRAEFGPRALGNRSVLADPRDPAMKARLNAQVKFRESFRPFAPAILHEHGPAYFYDYQESPFMERTLRFREEVRDRVPAVVHVDGTGRLQTVKREWNQKFYDLIQAFYRLSGVPLVLNTSFNVMGKPIIHSVEDALGLFYTTGLEALVMGDYLIEK
ncbi:MAG: carbamoyltransferase family protein [Gammaproteobacteria bacterium]